MRLQTFAIAVGLVGCALPPPPPSGNGNGNDDEGVDAGSISNDDESDVDAGPRPDPRPEGGGDKELSHSNSLLIVPGNSIACHNQDDSTAQNSYYRVFQLSEFDVSGAFKVDRVEFAVDEADDGNGNNQTITVRLHTLNGALTTNNLTQLATSTVSVGNVAVATLTADFNDVNVPAGSTLAVEIQAPDGDNNNATFYIGSNPGGQTGPSYIRSSECGDDQPEDLTQTGFPNMHIIMRVFGSG